MHHCLSILELVDNICEHLQGVDDGLGTLAALARTCRSFHDPALNYLWADQHNGLVNLIRCMPPDLLKNEGLSPRLLRPILVSDWERPRIYMRRIRSISALAWDKPESDFFGALLASLPGDVASLFPKLMSLLWGEVWWSSGPDVSFWARSLLSPRLASLSISTLSKETLLSFINIPTTCPTLKNLKLSCQSHPFDADIRSAFSSCLRNLYSLESVDAEIPDMVTLEHLSRLDTLTSLTAGLSDDLLFTGTSLPFIVLKRLNIKYDVERVTDFVQRCSGTPLKDIVIRLNTCPSTARMARLHSALRDGCSHSSLSSLTIEIDEDYALEPESDAMTIHSLRLLFCFTNVTSVSITSLGFDMDDRGMKELARAWPQLTELRLKFAGPDGDTELHPRFSLHSLRILAQHCRALTELKFTLDATAIPESDPDVIPQLALRGFDVGRSPITSPITSTPLHVAQFISALFPNLARITTICTDGNYGLQFELQDEDFAHHRLWMEVSAQIPVLVATGEAERL
ncbi:hypothetical protein C8R45DRAFT_900967 [Mycena sanguinolenta]|nr:hypothetical protein C8R45DRAFT_900967 [Mycena sanguinolenta]